MDRNTNGARLVRDSARDGLPDPPGGVGGELVSAAILELVRGTHQADVALLNQVEQVESAVDVLLGHGDDEAEVCFHQVLLRPFGLHFAVPDDGERMPELRKGSPGDHLALPDLLAQFADAALGVGGVLVPALGHLAEVRFELRQFIGYGLEFLHEVAPLAHLKRNSADAQRGLHPRPVPLAQ